MDSRLADVLMKSRYDGGKSQTYLAKGIGVSKKTIQHWESGVSQPSIEHLIEWFKACGVNPMHYLLEYISPGAFDRFNYNDKDTVDKAFRSLSKNLPHEDKLAMLYIYYGQHGSSPESIMQMILAHLHNPLRDRISIAIHIATYYRLNESTDTLVGGSLPQPNMEMLDEAILAAAESVKNKDKGYVVSGR